MAPALRPGPSRVTILALHVLNSCMRRMLTITIADEVYEGLYRRVGRRKISRFLEGLARPHAVDADLEAEYRAMASDEAQEADAEEWSEGLISGTSRMSGVASS